MTRGSSTARARSSGPLNGLLAAMAAALFFPIPGRADRADIGMVLMSNGRVMPVIERKPQPVTVIS
ncbi:MAG: hypothetical protein A3Q59_05055 [Methanomethylophilus alvi]|jgi:hypothetical protein|nr:MAG: hypothetical protein A3Q59_05055 [Methanomethylophilus alvi]